MVKRIIGGFFLSLILLWLFAPKQELYYLLEKNLKEKDIIISNETLKDTWYGLNISNADIYVKGIKSAHSAQLKLSIFFLYNTLSIDNLEINDDIPNMGGQGIETFNATYSIIDPTHITMKGFGSFGSLDGEFTIMKQHLKILFPMAKNIQSFKKYLKKDEKGVWKYETFNKK